MKALCKMLGHRWRSWTSSYASAGTFTDTSCTRCGETLPFVWHGDGEPDHNDGYEGH